MLCRMSTQHMWNAFSRVQLFSPVWQSQFEASQTSKILHPYSWCRLVQRRSRLSLFQWICGSLLFFFIVAGRCWQKVVPWWTGLFLSHKSQRPRWSTYKIFNIPFRRRLFWLSVRSARWMRLSSQHSLLKNVSNFSHLLVLLLKAFIVFFFIESRLHAAVSWRLTIDSLTPSLRAAAPFPS